MEKFKYSDFLKEKKKYTDISNKFLISAESCQSSNESLIDFIYGAFSKIVDFLTGFRELFFSFSNRNFQDINIYIRDVEKNKTKLNSLLTKKPTIYAALQDKEVPYIEGCNTDLLTLSAKLLKINQSLDGTLETVLNYLDKIVSLSMGNKEWQESNKLVNDKEFVIIAKLNKELDTFFKETMDINKNNDTSILRNIIPNVNSLKLSADNITQCDKYAGLKHIRRFNDEATNIKNKIDILIDQIKDKELTISSVKLKYLAEVLGMSANILTNYSGITSLTIEAAKTFTVIVKIMEEYKI